MNPCFPEVGAPNAISNKQTKKSSGTSEES